MKEIIKKKLVEAIGLFIISLIGNIVFWLIGKTIHPLLIICLIVFGIGSLAYWFEYKKQKNK